MEENKNAVMYGCVTGSLDKKDSYEGYKERTAARAENSGYHIAHFYIDDCTGGVRPLRERAEFNQMLMDAKADKIKQIVLLNTSGFSRDMDETLAVTRELKEYGAKVFAILENIDMDVDDNHKFATMASLAQAESNKLSERIERGVAARKARRYSGK